MHPVILTAVGVGGATVFGALIGFIFKRPSHKFNDIILSFAAGVMLSAAVMGLIVESFNEEEPVSLAVTVIGIFAGAVCLNLIDKLVPHLHGFGDGNEEAHPEKQKQLSKVLLFVIAIAIHNLPEGIAAGVSFGSGNTAQAMTVAGGIALQNIPEGMVIIAPMIASGISKSKTLLIAAATGLIEVIGTFIGFFAVSVSEAVLPFALAFAGGTMLYVISDEMIPETHAHGNERAATYSLLAGFCLMMIFDVVLGG
ncbi:MAG: ZIP family metal transporter [Ruminococcaceae bacterium]|nr:ZIP family metal transporter [Oscillospiraceae bacterium]